MTPAWLVRERRERNRFTWFAAAVGLIAGIGMTLAVVHITREDDPCVSAAMLAHDAYVTGEPGTDLDAAMRECADSAGGF